jgi:hypothetical protein
MIQPAPAPVQRIQPSPAPGMIQPAPAPVQRIQPSPAPGMIQPAPAPVQRIQPAPALPPVPVSQTTCTNFVGAPSGVPNTDQCTFVSTSPFILQGTYGNARYQNRGYNVVQLHAWQNYLAYFRHLPNNRIELTFLNSNAPGHDIVRWGPTINITYGTCPSLPAIQPESQPGSLTIPENIITVRPAPIQTTLVFINREDITKRRIITSSLIISSGSASEAYNMFSVNQNIYLIQTTLSKRYYLLIVDGDIADIYSQKYLYDFEDDMRFVDLQHLLYKRSFISYSYLEQDIGENISGLDIFESDRYYKSTPWLLTNSVSIIHGPDIDTELYDYFIQPESIPTMDPVEDWMYEANNNYLIQLDPVSITGTINLVVGGNVVKTINSAFMDTEYSCQFNSGFQGYNVITNNTGMENNSFRNFTNITSLYEAAQICHDTPEAVGFLYVSGTVYLFNYNNINKASAPVGNGMMPNIRRSDIRFVRSAINSGSFIGANTKKNPVTSTTYMYKNIQLFSNPHTVNNRVCMVMSNIPLKPRYFIGTLDPRTLLNRVFSGVGRTNIYPMIIRVRFSNPLITINLKVYIQVGYQSCKLQNADNGQYITPNNGSTTDPNSLDTNWYFFLPYFNSVGTLVKDTFNGTSFDCVFMNTQNNQSILYGNLDGTITRDYKIDYMYRHLNFYNSGVCEYYESNNYNIVNITLPHSGWTNSGFTAYIAKNSNGVDLGNPGTWSQYQIVSNNQPKYIITGQGNIDTLIAPQGVQIKLYIDNNIYGNVPYMLIRGTETGLMSKYNITTTYLNSRTGSVGSLATHYQILTYPTKWPPWDKINKTVCILRNSTNTVTASLKPCEYWEPGLWGSTLRGEDVTGISVLAGFKATLYSNDGFSGSPFIIWGPQTITDLTTQTGEQFMNGTLFSIKIEPILIPSSINRPVARLYRNANKTGPFTDIYNNDYFRVFNEDPAFQLVESYTDPTNRYLNVRNFDILEPDSFNGTISGTTFSLITKNGTDTYVRFKLEDNYIKILNPFNKDDTIDVLQLYYVNELQLVGFNSSLILTENASEGKTNLEYEGPRLSRPSIPAASVGPGGNSDMDLGLLGLLLLAGVLAGGALAGRRRRDADGDERLLTTIFSGKRPSKNNVPTRTPRPSSGSDYKIPTYTSTPRVSNSNSLNYGRTSPGSYNSVKPTVPPKPNDAIPEPDKHVRIGPRLTPQFNKVSRAETGVTLKEDGTSPGTGTVVRAPPSRNPLSPTPPRDTPRPQSRKIPDTPMWDGDVSDSDARPQPGSGAGGTGPPGSGFKHGISANTLYARTTQGGVTSLIPFNLPGGNGGRLGS